MNFNGTSTSEIIAGHDLSLCVNKSMSNDLRTGSVTMLHVTVISETEKAIQVAPATGNKNFSLWLPRKAVIIETKHLPGIGETTLYSLAPWYGQNGYAARFIDYNSSISVLGGRITP